MNKFQSDTKLSNDVFPFMKLKQSYMKADFLNFSDS